METSSSMETFTLATVSLIIAVSLFIKKKNDPVQLSFAALCIAVFIQKGGSFFHAIFNSDFWKMAWKKESIKMQKNLLCVKPLSPVMIF